MVVGRLSCSSFASLLRIIGAFGVNSSACLGRPPDAIVMYSDSRCRRRAVSRRVKLDPGVPLGDEVHKTVKFASVPLLMPCSLDVCEAAGDRLCVIEPQPASDWHQRQVGWCRPGSAFPQRVPSPPTCFLSGERKRPMPRCSVVGGLKLLARLVGPRTGCRIRPAACSVIRTPGRGSGFRRHSGLRLSGVSTFQNLCVQKDRWTQS